MKNSKHKPFLVTAGLVVAVLLLAAGNKQGSTPLAFPQPANFPPPVYRMESNPLTKEGFELGRKLFYDPLLSRDGSISCATSRAVRSPITATM